MVIKKLADETSWRHQEEKAKLCYRWIAKLVINIGAGGRLCKFQLIYQLCGIIYATMANAVLHILIKEDLIQMFQYMLLLREALSIIVFM